MRCRALRFDQANAKDPVARIFHGDQGPDMTRAILYDIHSV
jgi:hypothetical protein